MSFLDVAATGNIHNVVREMRVRALFSPYYFIKVILGYKDLIDHLHLPSLELFISRWEEGNRKQWIQFPRGFFKTTCWTIGTSIWIVLPVTQEDTDYALDVMKIPAEVWFKRVALHDQDSTQLIAMESKDNATRKLKEIAWHFESNQLFRNLFSEIAYQGTEKPWNNDSLKIRRTPEGAKTAEGTFDAIGVDGALQSRHYRIVWEDDLVGKAATESQVTMLSTIRWHGLLAGAFENAAYQTRFGVSNRWAYEDLNSYIQQNEPDFVFHSISAIGYDEEGQPYSVWPERYPLERLFAIRDSGSMTRYDFNCQYLNDPILPGEKEIQLDRLHTYTVEEGGKMVCSCGASWYPSQLMRYLHYDPYNAKGVRSTSCPAIVAVGTSVDKHVILLDTWTTKGSYAQVFDKLFSLNKQWRPHYFTYEDVGNQNMAEFFIKERQTRPDYKGAKFPPIYGVPTGGKPKEIRIRDYLFPVLKGDGQRKFAYRKGSIFEKQVESFPMASLEHDYDVLDCLAQGAVRSKSGYSGWTFPQSFEELQTTKQEEESMIKRIGTPYTHQEVA